MTVENVIIGVFIILGIWKLFEICFKRAKQKCSVFRFHKFCAEFLYKIVRNEDDFKDAPQEVYDWVATEYVKWLKQKR